MTCFVMVHQHWSPTAVAKQGGEKKRVVLQQYTEVNGLIATVQDSNEVAPMFPRVPV